MKVAKVGDLLEGCLFHHEGRGYIIRSVGENFVTCERLDDGEEEILALEWEVILPDTVRFNGNVIASQEKTDAS
jgi:hypothetical protein